MGRKKIRYPYEKRSHLITFRLKYWEHQKLATFSSKIKMSVSDVCRMFVSHGIDGVNQSISEREIEDTRPEMTGRPPGF
ncbi:MAG: hypothetical protein KAS71_09710 [Bacteroidales bacterium]|nr:hypothetical protein [Bacteroidales bacterium]